VLQAEMKARDAEMLTLEVVMRALEERVAVAVMDGCSGSHRRRRVAAAMEGVEKGSTTRRRPKEEERRGHWRSFSTHEGCRSNVDTLSGLPCKQKW
jgi:hypothetical protein